MRSLAPGTNTSTAPMADRCQPFLDNIIAQFSDAGAQNEWGNCVGSEVTAAIKCPLSADFVAEVGDYKSGTLKRFF